MSEDALFNWIHVCFAIAAVFATAAFVVLTLKWIAQIITDDEDL